MPARKQDRVLPADVYDTLELSALAFGGIGMGHFYERYGCGMNGPVPLDGATPLCGIGHLVSAGAGPVPAVFPGIDSTQPDFRSMPGPDENDEAVRRINRRRGRNLRARVPFAAWAAELNVVRGS